ncbi:MAG: DUF4861 family protein, partial [Candidatus Eisenbacteria bacterium]|nr:DUF4861 family protein [Candidatus Eisenbacteria bacterium]
LEMGGGFLASEARPARPASAFDVEIAAPAAAEDSPETAMTIAIADVPGAARAILDPWSRIEAIPVADRGDRIVGHDRTHRRDDRTHRRDDPIPGDQDRIAGQPEDYDGDGQVDLLYFPHVVPPDDAEPPGRLRIEIDPARPLPLPEGTRVDPFLGRSIAIESAAAAFRTYDGKVDLLAKRAPRLILKGDLGNVHEMRSWGIDPLDIGDGPGIGGPYVRTFRAQDAHAQEWIPMFGSDAVLGARVLVAGPLRSVVEVQLARGQTRARRRLEMRSGSPVLREEFVLEAPDSILVAFALPPLEVHGTMEASGDGQPGAIWSFGVSAPGAGALGLAGAGGRDLSPARAEEPDGARSAGASPEPALKRVARRGEPIRLLWVAGGEISGDSSAAAWTTRATALLRDPGLAGSESASPPRP